ncbi:MAG: SUMF1/EgtB/PvdO family nonheme iron enzyme [Cyclobacteriaceae bacterium]
MRILSLLLLSTICSAQTRLVVVGNVFNARTKEPLSYATISVVGKPEHTISTSDGSFRLLVPTSHINDTLSVSFLGFKPFFKKISSLESVQKVFLEEAYTVLDEVVISHAELDVRELERKIRKVGGNLCAMSTEVTNEQYNLFLTALDELGKAELRKKCEYDLSGYDESARLFFKNYVTKFQVNEKFRDSLSIRKVDPQRWDFPAVNVSYEAAQEYCKWLSDEYNNYSKKKKYKQVLFRLPSLQEWQIAALGDSDFQSWILNDNMVEVRVADSMQMHPKKGALRTISAKDILYPWYGSYYYRKSPQNHKGCFLGNFRVDSVQRECPAIKGTPHAYDGFSMMAITAAYFPNDIGLYDVVGNVAEMVDEKGKACGGSWDDPPSQSTIHSVKTYNRPNATVGFRVFMEVIEE